MSQIPQPPLPPPLPYRTAAGYPVDPYAQPGWPMPEGALPYAIPQTLARPSSATVIAIIGIVYASIAILVYGWTLVGIMFINTFVGAMAMPFWPQQLMVWYMVWCGVGLCISGLLMTAGIALLRNTSWSRRLMIGYAIVDLTWAVIATAVSVFYVIPEQQKQWAAAGMPVAAMSGNWFGSVVWLIVLATFPTIALVFMTRPNVRGFYEGTAR